MKSNLLLNPFTRIAGWKATGIGFVGLIILSLVTAIFMVQLTPFIKPEYADILNRVTHKGMMWVLYIAYFIVMLVAYIVLTFLETFVMWIAALIVKSQPRFIDLLGTSVLSSAPNIIVWLVMLFVPPVMSSLTGTGVKVILLFIPALLAIAATIWCYILMYNGYKVSTGLKGNKLVISFMSVVIVFVSLFEIPAILQQWNLLSF